MSLRVGVVINPVAGLGGPAALQGSDGADVQTLARAGGALPAAELRATAALQCLTDRAIALTILTWGGGMGADAVAAAGLACAVLGAAAGANTTAADTAQAVRVIASAGVDVLVFVGGDGTARDVLQALPADQLALGVPAGVKMHSSVFAVTPRAAGEVLRRLVDGGLVAVTEGEVRDVDEQALRAGELRNRYFGAMRVPALAGFMQHLKEGGREHEPLAQEELVAAIVAELKPTTCYLLGPGATLQLVKQRLGMRATLLGVDVICHGEQLAENANAAELLTIADKHQHAVIVLSPSRGQGALLGRGNQQISAAVVRAAQQRLLIVATRGKLAALAGRAMFVDTGDAALDQELSGLAEVLVGFEERLLYRIATV